MIFDLNLLFGSTFCYFVDKYCADWILQNVCQWCSAFSFIFKALDDNVPLHCQAGSIQREGLGKCWRTWKVLIWCHGLYPLLAGTKLSAR